jgi:hypothetical protein
VTFESRVSAIVGEKFTERQARFLVTVMLHSGVCMIRQYCVFAHMVYGQTARDFFARLVARKLATVCDCAHKRARIFHIHHRSLYTAIGEPHNRFRKPAPIARAIERLMLLDTVLAGRELSWLATERDKLAHFTVLLGTRFRREELPHLTFGQEAKTTVRYFPDKLPIGLDVDARLYVFVYLVTRPAPVDFRAFLHRHAELLRALPRWTIRIVLPPHFAKAAAAYEAACRQELASPLRPSLLEELLWFFQHQRAWSNDPPHVPKIDVARYEQARLAFSAPRFRALYRSWRRHGVRALDAAASPVIGDALSRGTGRIECQTLPRAYLHLSPLVSTA